MKKLFGLVGIFAVFPIFGLCQNTRKTRLIEIPSERGLVAVVSQPECPLRIIMAQLFTKEDGQYPIVRYVVKNNSPKPIRYFSVMFAMKFTIGKWHRFGSGTGESIGRSDGKGQNLLLNGDTYSNWPESTFETVPINNAVKEILQNKPETRTLKFVGAGMVTKVIFSDGSRCEAEDKYNDLYDLLMLDD